MGVTLQPAVRFGRELSGKPKQASGLRRAIQIALISIPALIMPSGCAHITRALNGNIAGDRFERNTELYVSPTDSTGYTDNPQRSIPEEDAVKLRQYCGEDKATLGAPVEQLRARFNATEDINLLNPFLPYRTALTRRISQETDSVLKQVFENRLATHDAQIRAFVTSPHVQFWFVDKQNKIYPLDHSTRFLIAGLIVDLLHNRPDLIESTIRRTEPFRIIVTEDLHRVNFFSLKREKVGGYWAPGSGDIEIDNRNLWIDSGCREDGEDTAIHEFIHAAESVKYKLLFGISVADGMLPGLSEEDALAFRQERAALFRKFKELNGGQSYDEVEASGMKMTSIPGIRDYAFKNRAEFLAASHENFFDSPRAFREATPIIYDIYKRYYRLDPAEGYQDLN